MRVGGVVKAKFGSRTVDAGLTPTAVVEIAGIVINVYGDAAVNVTAPQVNLTGTAKVTIASAGEIALSAPALTMTGNLTLVGNLTVVGFVNAAGDVAANYLVLPVHLGLHVHPFVGVPPGNLSATTPSVGP